MPPVRWRRAGLFVLLVAYVALTLYTLASHLPEKPLPQFLMEDYGYYARAFQRWQAGASPYDDRSIGTAFLYPPQALLLVGAFEALGPMPLKFAIYATLSLLALLATIVMALRACEISPADPRCWLALVLGFAFAPVGWCLYLGQVNLFVALTVAAGFFLAERRPYAAGTAIAVGAALKLTPIVLLAMLLHRRYLRVHAAFLATSALLVAITGAVFGFGQFATYVGVAGALKETFPLGKASLSVINTLFFLAGVLERPLSGWYEDGQLAYSAFLCALILCGAWLTRNGQHRHLLFALVALAMTVMPNVLWYHHLVFALPALLVLLLSPESTPGLRAATAGAFGVIQLDRLLQPTLDKFTTVPVCLLLIALTLVALVRTLPRFSLVPAAPAVRRTGSAGA